MQFLSFFWQICLMRRGPEQAPESMGFIIFIAAIYTCCSMILLWVSRTHFDVIRGILMVLLGLGIQSICTWLLLAFKSHYRRFKATFVSLLGTNSILVLMLIPVNFLLLVTDNNNFIVLIEIVYWLFFMWWITVAGFILQKALNISLIQGMALAFTMELLSLITSSSLLPEFYGQA